MFSTIQRHFNLLNSFNNSLKLDMKDVMQNITKGILKRFVRCQINFRQAKLKSKGIIAERPRHVRKSFGQNDLAVILQKTVAPLSRIFGVKK